MKKSNYHTAIYVLWFSLFFFLGNNATAEIEQIRKAAEQGDAEAQTILGACYLNGAGVPENKTEAIKWLRMAAEQGNALAQGALGVCYFRGDGVPENKTEAIKWFRMAAEQGNEEAAALLQNVEARAVESVQREMLATSSFSLDTLYTFPNRIPQKPVLEQFDLPKPVAPTLIRKPQFTRPTMGEFEEQADFDRRKERAEAAHKEAMQKYETDLANQKTKHDEAVADWERRQQQSIARNVVLEKNYNENLNRASSITMFLPLSVEFVGQFNRQTMTFTMKGSLHTDALQRRVGGRRTDIVVTPSPNITFTTSPFSTLQEAETFKRQITSGELVYHVLVDLHFMSNADKRITIKPAVTREVVDNRVGENVATAVIMGGLAAAFGKDPFQHVNNNFQALPSERRTEVVTPAVYEDIHENKFRNAKVHDHFILVNRQGQQVPMLPSQQVSDTPKIPPINNVSGQAAPSTPQTSTPETRTPPRNNWSLQNLR